MKGAGKMPGFIRRSAVQREGKKGAIRSLDSENKNGHFVQFTISVWGIFGVMCRRMNASE